MSDGKVPLETIEDAIRLMSNAKLPEDQSRAVTRMIYRIRYLENENTNQFHQLNPEQMGR